MEQILELMNRRRRQILVHSCLYYRFNENIISDHTYDMWCKELAELQIKHPEVSKQGVYYEFYKDFDGSTGFDLPIHNTEIINTASRILNTHKKRG